MECVREGVRRMESYMEAQTTKIGLRKVALSPIYTKSGKTRTFSCAPTTRKVDSRDGTGRAQHCMKWRERAIEMIAR